MKISYYITCFTLALCSLVSVSFADSLRTVILSGKPALGTGDGVTFAQFRPPVLNNKGWTAFRGELTGTAIDETNNTGIWSDRSGATPSLVARAGSPAPGTNVNFGSLYSSDPLINSSGQIAFRATLSGLNIISADDSGIWSEGRGELALVAREGNPAPGTNVNFAHFFFDPALNNNGQTAFYGFLTDTSPSVTTDRGIWSEASGNTLSLIVRAGSAPPGTDSSAVFTEFDRLPTFNDSGQTAFQGLFTNSSLGNTGIWSKKAGVLELAVREGSDSPTTGSDIRFRSFSPPVLNDSGRLAFAGIVIGVDVDLTNNRAVWSEGAGNGLALVARKGDQAPGTDDEISFAYFDPPVLNGKGQTAFRGLVAGSQVDILNNGGIWSENTEGGLTLIAREGNAAPDTGDGVRFKKLFLPTLNVNGQVAFYGTLTGAGVTSTNTSGIWAQDFSGRLRQIARNGDLLDVDDSPATDFRKIKSLGFFGNTGNEDGRRSGFNDLGQVAFNATFTDGTSGIFVSSLVAIPEPSTLVLAALSAVGILLNRRR